MPRKPQIVLLIAMWAAPLLVQASAPYIPPSADTVLLQRPAGRKAAPQLAPQSAEAAAMLARLAIERGRASGDPREFGRAQAALGKWWSDPAPPDVIRLLRATLLQQRHNFKAALLDLDAVILADPAAAQARLTRASLHQAMGNPQLALPDCEALRGRVYPLTITTCQAASTGIAGQLRASIGALRASLATDAAAPPAERLWALNLLAELLEAAGDTAGAEAAYRSALLLAPKDPYLMATLSDFWLAAGQPQRVLSLLKGQTQNDTLLLRIALAQQALAKQNPKISAEASARQLADRYTLAESRGENFHAREQARFALELQGDATAALAFAQRNWQAQREPADARLLLQSALAAHKPAAAAEVRSWMLKTGIEDQRLQALAQQLDALH